ncbi:MAG: hypothetical protein JO190_00775 [Candidatus Eremiobacteraeota bacterium]|nr:hypothetical protein [Candidatus Eremiobacteraeota bacterium]
MTTSTALRPSVRAAFAALIDYAGLFPPAQLALPAAQAEYAAARSGPHAWMLGRFILPAAALPAWAGINAPLSVILDAGTEELSRLDAMRERNRAIEAIEVPPKLWAQGETFADAIKSLSRHVDGARAGLDVFVEIPRAAHSPQTLAQTMAAVARAGFGAKLRCGGVTSDAFPTVDEVTDFIAAANRAGVRFKATAGLHHPVRHLDGATGISMHGFLNLLAASALAPRVDTETLRRIVAEEDARAFRFDDASFAWRDERVTADELARMRRVAFVAYGSCSFSEPVADLSALGLLSLR